jgi:DNA-binding beta-propeller fold protein YncE
MKIPPRLVTTAAFIIMTAFTAPLNAELVVVDVMRGFKGPARVAVSGNGNVFVTVHEKGQLAVLDSTGIRITTLGGLGAPLGLAILDVAQPEPPVAEEPSLGLPVIYVGDEKNGTVKVINNGHVSALGSGAGEFEKPNGIAVTTGRTVYVVDSNANQVKVYDNFGTLLTTFGGEGAAAGQFNFPIDIVVNEALGEVYVTDFWNERIGVFDLAGGFVRNIIAPENDAKAPAFLRPSGLGIDPAGNLYVVDSALSCVVILDNTGALIDIIGYENGQYWTGELSLPTDAAADGQRIYVTSSHDGVVKVFEEVAQ